MKLTIRVLTLLTLCAYALNPTLAKDDKDHKDHDHDHDHEKVVAGPNGGRVLTDVEPHLEFLVNDDRTVTITALDDHNKAAKITGQTVKLVAGKRSKPTKLTFSAKDGKLVSSGKLPAGNDFPVVVQIKPKKGAKSVNAKFNLNLKDCPTCDYKEYACACDHGHDHKDHDHKDHDHKDHDHKDHDHKKK